MPSIDEMFQQNRIWAEAKLATDPDYFHKLAGVQKPKAFWIGCSDSRVPADEILGLHPGELFVHRNIANIVSHTDFNVLSALYYAVFALKVEHVIVCGHYGCGGIKTVVMDEPSGFAHNWLMQIRDVQEKHHDQLEPMSSASARLSRLCEINAIEQARSVALSNVMQEAWRMGMPVAVHAWIYGIHDGLLRDLNLTVTCREDVYRTYRSSLFHLQGSHRHVVPHGEE